MIAVSSPDEKETMVKVIINLFNGKNWELIEIERYEYGARMIKTNKLN